MSQIKAETAALTEALKSWSVGLLDLEILNVCMFL